MTTYDDLPKVWVPDPKWTVGGNGKRCRMPKCGKDAAATLLRGYHRRTWNYAYSELRSWAYCADHLYGRRINNGIVEWEVVKQ